MPTDLSRSQRTEHAIRLAAAAQWAEAVTANEALLDEDPTDIAAANRLGKALTELGEESRAVAAYERALAAEPGNPIARKNLDRLRSAAPLANAVPGGGQHATDERTTGAPIVAASGRSAEFLLLRPDAGALAICTVGEAAAVEASEHGVRITTTDGTMLGTIERRAGRRLGRLIAGGNAYRVSISRLRSVSDGVVEAVVRIDETRRSAQQADETSFLQPRAKSAAPRAYSSDTRYDTDEPPDMGDADEDGERDWNEPLSDSDGDAMKQRGFSPTAFDDDTSPATEDEDEDDEDEDEDAIADADFEDDDDLADDEFPDDDELDDDLADADFDDDELDDDLADDEFPDDDDDLADDEFPDDDDELDDGEFDDDRADDDE